MSRRMRGHFLIIFEGTSIWQLLSIFLVPLFFGFTGRKLDIGELVVYILIFWFNTISKFFRYLSTLYTFLNDQILIESGLINKKKTEIPYNSITTIDLSQNILQRLFNVYKIKLDNASQVSDLTEKAEVTLVMRANEAFAFRESISKRTANEIDQEKESISAQQEHFISATTADFLLLGALRSKSAYFVTLTPVVLGIAGFFISLFTGVKDEERMLNMVFGSSIALAVILSFIVIYASTFAFSIVKSIITYYGFGIISKPQTIDVEFGLFVKKKYSLPKAKINGIIIRQNLIMQIFGYCSIDVCVIGYGDKSDQNTEGNGMLFPITTLEKAVLIVNTLLPGFDTGKVINRSPQRALRYFFIRPLPIITLTALIGVCFTKNIWLISIFMFFLTLILLNAYKEYKNSGIGLNESTITISTGGFIKREVIIKSESIESVSAATSYFKRRKSIASLEVRFLAPLRNSDVQVKNMDVSHFRELENKLTF